MIASPAHVVLELFVGIPLPSWLVVLFVVPGLLASLVGVVGLYPSVSDRAPRLALAGVASATVAGTMLVVLLGWTLGATLLPPVSGLVVGPPPGVVFVSLPVTMTLGSVLFGVASLRSGVPSRTVGGLLLAFATPWIVVLAATPVYGAAFPRWLTLAVYGPLPVVMLATGYAIRAGSVPTEREDATTDVVTG